MIYRFDNFELDLARIELRKSGKPLAIEPQVFDVLLLLIENRERMVSKNEILEQVWNGRVVSESAMSSRIKSLRRLLGDTGDKQEFIRTIRGRGFRFVACVDLSLAEIEASTQSVSSLKQSTGNHDTVAEPEEKADAASGQNYEDAKPALAVLPFQWLGTEKSYVILADALPQEIITALSRLRWLSVIARGSTFQFREADLDVQHIGKVLNVGYCFTGSVEHFLQEIRISVDLIDTKNGTVVWGDQFNFKIDRILEVRTEIVAKIVSALEIQIPQHEASLARLASPDSLNAWAEYHLGLQAMYRFTNLDNAAATLHFRRAVDLAPNFTHAHAGLSFTSFQDAFLKYSNNIEKSIRQAHKHAERSLELDPYDAFANFTMGRSCFLTGDYESSFSWLDRSIELCPNYAQGLYSRAWAEVLFGNASEALPAVEAAMRLSPLDPLQYAMMGTRSLAYIEKQDFPSAAYWAEKAATAPNSHAMLGYVAVIAHSLNGDAERALYWKSNLQKRRPDITRQLFFESFPFTNKVMRAVIEKELKKCGL